MGVLSRIGIALDSDLLKRFDRSMRHRVYTVVGTVTLIYDHHAHGVSEKLTELQHASHELIVSTSHAHLDHDSCLEVLIVHGKSGHVSQFADRIIGLKGVQHGQLVMTVPAKVIDEPEAAAHNHTHEHSHDHPGKPRHKH
jgi:CopG family nickel-responsive transcriptional regulator